MAFTPYVAVAAFLVAGVALALRNWAAAAVAALATLCLAAAVLPRAIGDGTVDPAGRETLSVLSANVYRGTGDPRGAGRPGRPLRRRPAQRPGADARASPASCARPGSSGACPNAIEETRQGAAGAGIYSRLPLRRSLPGLAVLLPHAARRPAPARRPPPPRRRRPSATRRPHRASTIWEDSLGEPAGDGRRRALGPDRRLQRHPRPLALRESLDRGYRDAGDVAGEGLEPTWPNRRPHPAAGDHHRPRPRRRPPRHRRLRRRGPAGLRPPLDPRRAGAARDRAASGR